MKTLVLFCSHRVNDKIVARFQKLVAEVSGAADVRFVFNGNAVPDAAEAIGERLVQVTNEDLVALPYSGKMGGERFTVVPGNADLLVLYVARKVTQAFDHVWYLEYDVHYEGDWSIFFRDFADNDADFLATKLRRKSRDENWMWWDSLKAPAWEGDYEAIASFNPVMRLSRRAIETVDLAYCEGWKGHYEATLATILTSRGLTKEDIGGTSVFTPKQRRGLYYSHSGFRVMKHDEDLVFQPGRLYHPVKLNV